MYLRWYVCTYSRYNAHMYVRIYDGMYVRTVGITHTCKYVFTMECMYVCWYNAHMYVRFYDGMYVRV